MLLIENAFRSIRRLQAALFTLQYCLITRRVVIVKLSRLWEITYQQVFHYKIVVRILVTFRQSLLLVTWAISIRYLVFVTGIVTRQVLNGCVIYCVYCISVCIQSGPTTAQSLMNHNFATTSKRIMQFSLTKIYRLQIFLYKSQVKNPHTKTGTLSDMNCSTCNTQPKHKPTSNNCIFTRSISNAYAIISDNN